MKAFPTSLHCLERIFSINSEIIANSSLEGTLHSIVQVAAELVDCENAGILLSDAAGDTLNFVAVTQHTDRLFEIPVPIDHSISGSAFTSNQPVIVYDVQHDPRYYPQVDALLNFPVPQSILSVPLTFRERKIGVLQVIDKKTGRFDEADIEVMVVLAAQATITIEIGRLYRQAQAEIAERIRIEDELRRHQDHLEELVKERTAEVHRLAILDSLTGLYNRGHLMTLGVQSMRKAAAEQDPFSAMMIDIDHFKKINETYGHTIGDAVLKQLAVLLKAHFRPDDIIGRHDGEEFTVLLPRTNLEEAHALADQVLEQIREIRMDTDQGQFGFTASIGLVEMDQTNRQTLDSLIDQADQAMDAAKRAGRNQVFLGNFLAEVQRLAFTDPLTGLLSFGYWSVLGNQAIQEAQRYHTPVSAMMVDGDHIKNINDTYGHAMGDEAVKKLAETVRQNLRSADIIGRYGYGGDEFVILLPRTDLKSASELADRLMDRIRAATIDTGQGLIGISASIGVAEMDPTRRQTLEELMEKADQAVYAAKRAGRSQVRVSQAEAL